MTNTILLKSVNVFSYRIVVAFAILSLFVYFFKPILALLPTILTIVVFMNVASVANVIVYQDRIIIKKWLFHETIIDRNDILDCIIYRVRGRGKQPNYDELTIFTREKQYRLCSSDYLHYELLYRTIADKPICLPKDSQTSILITCVAFVIISILPSSMIIMSLMTIKTNIKDSLILLGVGFSFLVFLIYLFRQSIRWKDVMID
jgi:hypothetical protein